MGVAAAMRLEAELELRLLAVGNLRIQIGTVYACAVSVAALLDDIQMCIRDSSCTISIIY